MKALPALLVVTLWLVLGSAYSARAVPVATLDAVHADWSHLLTTWTGDTGADRIDSDSLPGAEEIRWGLPEEGKDPSGYRFAAAAPPSFGVASEFVLGTFTHFNNPIRTEWPRLLEARLNVTVFLTVLGAPVSSGPLTFFFEHDETPDSPGPCDDVASLSGGPLADTFVVGGQAFTLEILGFRKGGSPIDELVTPENGANTAELVGFLRGPPEPVPEPGTLVLLGSGLLGLASLGRRWWRR